MTFNEFTRRLAGCHIDSQTKYVLSHMFEVQVEYSKQLDQVLGMMLKLTETIKNSTDLQERMTEEVKQILRGFNGVEVRSVRNDPED